MYQVLKSNLELDRAGRRGIYFWIKNTLGIHLGVGDKSMLLTSLREHDHRGFFDLQYDYATFLWNMGYRSTKLKAIVDEDKRSCRRTAKRWMGDPTSEME